ncbi:RmlC-like cupin domain-containing protein [Phaeosphaeriaceae sp. PMI808]|nr:RmlC-like cupin domain-containing protein [Phaeosphaeriaceae sp. PMI808]
MADPLDFNDLFWNDLSAEQGSTSFSSTLVGTNTQGIMSQGSIAFSSKVASTDLTSFSSTPFGTTSLSIIGQGTVAVRSKATETLNFAISTGNGYPKLSLHITQTSCKFVKEDESHNLHDLTAEHVRPEANPHLSKKATADGTVYWLSIDRSNWILRYGKYYSCKALTILQVSLTVETGAWLGDLTSVNVVDNVSPLKIRISRLPVTMDLPPLVVANESVSLRELDLAKVTTWANLPKACQNLYHNIAGLGVTLETADFPDLALAEAIHKSVTTPGYWGYKKLQSKCSNPADDKEFVLKYLRVTIGSSKGNSPGIPYVMEVWPPGHRSVIHDHGNACAVIRVLSGAIQCTWYDSLESEKNPTQLGNPCLLRKGHVTWLGENQYQVHSLENIRDWTCVTLQCYEFDEENNVHDEKFWYVNGEASEKLPFTPNSDCTFAEFYDYMEWEWKNKKAYGS